MSTDNSAIDAYTDARTPSARLLLSVLGIGLLAAIGTALVALGLTDLLAYAAGYRPSHWVVYSYASALLVTAAGWSVVVGAVLWTVRTASLVR